MLVQKQCIIIVMIVEKPRGITMPDYHLVTCVQHVFSMLVRADFSALVMVRLYTLLTLTHIFA